MMEELGAGSFVTPTVRLVSPLARGGSPAIANVLGDGGEHLRRAVGVPGLLDLQLERVGVVTARSAALGSQNRRLTAAEARVRQAA